MHNRIALKKWYSTSVGMRSCLLIFALPSHCRLSSSSHCAPAPRYYGGVNAAENLHEVVGAKTICRKRALNLRPLHFEVHVHRSHRLPGVIIPGQLNNSSSAHHSRSEPQTTFLRDHLQQSSQSTYSSNPLSILAEIGAWSRDGIQKGVQMMVVAFVSHPR